MDWHDNWNVHGRVLRQKHPNQALPNLSHIKKALCSACTHCSMSPQSREANRCSCSHPQNARLPASLSSVGMTTSCSATQFRKTSLPICVSRGGSHIQFKATQWANVEERRAVISVLIRLTSTRLLQFYRPARPDIVEVTRQAELFNACAAECTFRQRSRFVSMVHVKGDGCKREATLEGIFAKLCPWCQAAAVLCFMTGPNST